MERMARAPEPRPAGPRSAAHRRGAKVPRCNAGPLLLVVVALLAAAAWSVLAAPQARAGAEDGAPPGTEVGDAIRALESPFLLEREQGVRELIRLGREARAAVAEAFGKATATTRASLVRVMAADGSAEALATLLDTLVGADTALATAIERALVEHAEAVSEGVERHRDASGRVPARIAELEMLLRRARVERAFLSRKSRSGSTGYYRGQFDVLAPERRTALEVCFHVLADRPLKVPGEYPLGAYRFLRPVPFLLDPWEVRGMAANAIAELARPGDTALLDAIERLYEEFDLAIRRHPGPGIAMEEPLSDTLLVTLHRLRPEGERKDPDGDHANHTWEMEVEERLDVLGHGSETDRAPALLLRLGRYREAISRYRQVIREEETIAIPHYNIACAYAMWSRENEDGQAAEHRKQAMDNLVLAVESGYMDWPWMEQDRDLDPIREDPRYERLLERVKAQFDPPPELSGPGRGRTLGPGDEPTPPPAAMEGSPPPAMGGDR